MHKLKNQKNPMSHFYKKADVPINFYYNFSINIQRKLFIIKKSIFYFFFQKKKGSKVIFIYQKFLTQISNLNFWCPFYSK